LAATFALVSAAACGNGPSDSAATNQPAASQTGFDARNPDPDEIITATIQGHYFSSPEIRNHQIAVETNAAVVTLTGTIASEAVKQRAVEIARSVDGVKDVNDRISVAPAALAGNERAAPVSDEHGGGPSWITTRIQAQYFADPDVNPYRIHVTTSDIGTVTLRGRVDSAVSQNKAIQIAQNTTGVTAVDNQLRVGPEPVATSGTAETRAESGDDGVSDTWLTAKIKSKYYLDGDVRGRDIDVSASRGVVTLRGTVGSYSERVHAVALARSIDGVEEIRDELQVESATARRSDSGPAAGTIGQKIDDAWITTKVQSKFFLHDDIKARDIDVETKNGVVTLSGSVASAAAKETAGYLVKETEGVRELVDNLRVATPAPEPATR
jgi:hyperosmotically inducible protein